MKNSYKICVKMKDKRIATRNATPAEIKRFNKLLKEAQKNKPEILLPLYIDKEIIDASRQLIKTTEHLMNVPQNRIPHKKPSKFKLFMSELVERLFIVYKALTFQGKIYDEEFNYAED